MCIFVGGRDRLHLLEEGAWMAGTPSIGTIAVSSALSSNASESAPGREGVEEERRESDEG
jgi:hypothetical protein